MTKPSLKQSNPYLKDPELCKALLFQTVTSSTAIEGVLTKYPRLSMAMEKKAEKDYRGARVLSVLRITEANTADIG